MNGADEVMDWDEAQNDYVSWVTKKLSKEKKWFGDKSRSDDLKFELPGGDSEIRVPDWWNVVHNKQTDAKPAFNFEDEFADFKNSTDMKSGDDFSIDDTNR